MLLYFGLGKPIQTFVSFSVPCERKQLQLARLNTISPYVGNIKIALAPKATIKEGTSPNRHQQIKVDVGVVCPPPPPPPPPQSYGLDHKHKRGVKKVLNMGIIVQDELKDDLVFPKDKDEEQSTKTLVKGSLTSPNIMINLLKTL